MLSPRSWVFSGSNRDAYVVALLDQGHIVLKRGNTKTAYRTRLLLETPRQIHRRHFTEALGGCLHSLLVVRVLAV